MDFGWIEPGTFTMGSPSSEPGRHSAEGPQHEVTISRGFWLGKYEKYVSEKVVPGFGPYGYSPRIEGPTTAEFVTAIQGLMKEEIAQLSAAELPS